LEWISGEEVGTIESLITGEGQVVKKKTGMEVLAGSMLVGGSVIMKVTRVGEMTVIKQIESLAVNAQNTRLEDNKQTNKIVDKVSGIFVPLVLLFAISTYITWRFFVQISNREALNYTLAVLMVSCPCALGLAAPTAVVMATSVAAKTLGAIVKSIHVLENLAKIKILIFDKTGTITVGRPTVSAIEAEFPPDLWKAIAALEAASEHPVGKAISEYAASRAGKPVEVQISEFRSEAAVGVSGIFEGQLVQIRGDVETAWLTEQRKLGRVAVGVLTDGQYQGGIALRDAPREDARSVVKMLKSRKIRVVMCTGDADTTAQAVAKEVGISEVYSKCTPHEKQKIVGDLKQDGTECVVMIGDGINDAPALASATVGMAVGSGVRIASESADVVLVRTNRLCNIVGLIDLSKSTLSCIKRNLLWAFGFNSIMIPWAAGVFAPLGAAKIPPALAGAAMAGSSVLVVVSSLLLGRFRAPASDRE
jgi:Cu+-exporting ATPase